MNADHVALFIYLKRFKEIRQYGTEWEKDLRIMNSKECATDQSWRNLRQLSTLAWNWEWLRKLSIRIVDIRTGNRTRSLLKINRCANRFIGLICNPVINKFSSKVVQNEIACHLFRLWRHVQILLFFPTRTITTEVNYWNVKYWDTSDYKKKTWFRSVLNLHNGL